MLWRVLRIKLKASASNQVIMHHLTRTLFRSSHRVLRVDLTKSERAQTAILPSKLLKNSAQWNPTETRQTRKKETSDKIW